MISEEKIFLIIYTGQIGDDGPKVMEKADTTVVSSELKKRYLYIKVSIACKQSQRLIHTCITIDLLTQYCHVNYVFSETLRDDPLLMILLL
jgi:hypothetical protein